MKIVESVEALNKLMGEDGDPLLKSLIRTSRVTDYATLMLDEINKMEDVELRYQTATLISQHLEDIRESISKAIEAYNTSKKDEKAPDEKAVDKEVIEPKTAGTSINDKLTAVTESEDK